METPFSHVALPRVEMVTFSTSSFTAVGGSLPPVTVHPPGLPATSATPSDYRPVALVPVAPDTVPLTTTFY